MSADEHLSASQFMARFTPGEYSTGGDWSEVVEHPAFTKRNPLNYRRTHAGTMDALVSSLREHGMREAVDVDEHGMVQGGHHRVVAAHAAGVAVRYTQQQSQGPPAPSDAPSWTGMNPRFYREDGSLKPREERRYT